MQRDNMIANITAASQIEVAVIGEVDHRSAIRRCKKIERQAIVVIERIGDGRA